MSKKKQKPWQGLSKANLRELGEFNRLKSFLTKDDPRNKNHWCRGASSARWNVRNNEKLIFRKRQLRDSK